MRYLERAKAGRGWKVEGGGWRMEGGTLQVNAEAQRVAENRRKAF